MFNIIAMQKNRFRLLGFLVIALMAGGMAQSDGTSGLVPYLGFSVPYPEYIPAMPLPESSQTAASAPLIIYLRVNKKGEVSKVEGDDSLSQIIKRYEDSLKAIRFAYTGGKKIDSQVFVPIRMFVRFAHGEPPRVDLTFPLTDDLAMDRPLFEMLLERNRIYPPHMESMPPLFFRFQPEADTATDALIVARLRLDEKGAVAEIDFPLAEAPYMKHALQMSLMRAAFAPAKHKKSPIGGDFLFVFHVFDNLTYPFASTDTTTVAAGRPFTAQFFVRSCFSANDLESPPLPRNYSRGFFEGVKLANEKQANVKMIIGIDSTGVTIAMSTRSGNTSARKASFELINQIEWYPARDCRGQKIPYDGAMNIIFDGSDKVVFSPEWLQR